MEESWRMLGINGCTTCRITQANMGDPLVVAERRTFAAAKDAVGLARGMRSMGRGYIGRADDVLKEAGLLDAHMSLLNPFFELPHADFECFPMDRLHGVYVTLSVMLFWVSCLIFFCFMSLSK